MVFSERRANRHLHHTAERAIKVQRIAKSNDTDPDGDYPLTLVGVTHGSHGFAGVASSTSVNFDGASNPRTDNLTYTVRNSRGATSIRTLEVATGSMSHGNLRTVNGRSGVTTAGSVGK
jgi:hypothetical protein